MTSRTGTTPHTEQPLHTHARAHPSRHIIARQATGCPPNTRAHCHTKHGTTPHARRGRHTATTLSPALAHLGRRAFLRDPAVPPLQRCAELASGAASSQGAGQAGYPASLVQPAAGALARATPARRWTTWASTQCLRSLGSGCALQWMLMQWHCPCTCFFTQLCSVSPCSRRAARHGQSG